MARHELVVMANRLPVSRVPGPGGQDRWETSPGGLVSALKPVLSKRTCTWIGWAGGAGDPPPPFEHEGLHYTPVGLSADELENFYEGLSNRALWPLYHDAIRTPEYRRTWWRPYVEVNRRFAQAAADALAPGGVAWVHDYHLQLVPRMLRELRPDAFVSFFLHIPFPPVELFSQLPWRREILRGLLGADLIGFQTDYGAQNFARLAERFVGAELHEDVLDYEGRRTTVGGFPISIDVEHFERLAAAPEAVELARDLRRQLEPADIVLLGVDRMDYTKGIDRRLKAFDTLLETNPDLAERVVFMQVAVPSRERVESYIRVRTEIERLVGHVNGMHSRGGRVPVRYQFRSLPPEELVSYYLAADVMVVTPLRDGMNLVAKEYVASRLDDSGVLVLSEFTGAAHQLESALLVNPHDVDGLAATLEEAVRMSDAEKRRRMSELRRVVTRNDVHAWAAPFLQPRTRV